MPNVGFAGFGNTALGGIPRGLKAGLFGGRKPPSAAYATFRPILHVNIDSLEPEEGAQFIGGMFWD